MQRGFGVARNPVEDLLVALDLGAGGELAGVEAIEGRLLQDLPRAADRLDPLAPILLSREVVEPECRVLPGVARPDLDRTAGVGVHRPDVHLVPVTLWP